MARELTDEEHEQLAENLRRHNAQVLAGVIPEGSPADFVQPDATDGLPWWFGPPDPNSETLVVGGDDSIG
jgi:hypothetical protein